MNFFALGKALSNLSKSYGYAVMMKSTGMNLKEYMILEEGISIFSQNCLKPFFKNCKSLIEHARKSKVQSIQLSSTGLEELGKVLGENPRLRAAMLDIEGTNAIHIMHYNKKLGIVA